MYDLPETHLAREAALLDRLEKRSRDCPGLFPVTSRIHWYNLARLALGLKLTPDDNSGSNDKTAARVWPLLENFDRHPDQASALLSRLLAEKENGEAPPLSLVSQDAKATAWQREDAIRILLSGQQMSSPPAAAEVTNGLQ